MRRMRGAALAAVNVAIFVSIAHAFTIELAIFLVLITILCFVEASLVDEVPSGGDNLAMLATLTGLAMLATFVTAIRFASASHRELLVAGAATMAAGVALRCIAIATLGARFVSELRVSGPRVRTGVYRVFDHPSEIGLMLVTLGAAILFRSVAALAIWTVVLLPVTIARVRIESSFLLSSSAS